MTSRDEKCQTGKKFVMTLVFLTVLNEGVFVQFINLQFWNKPFFFFPFRFLYELDDWS